MESLSSPAICFHCFIKGFMFKQPNSPPGASPDSCHARDTGTNSRLCLSEWFSPQTCAKQRLKELCLKTAFVHRGEDTKSRTSDEVFRFTGFHRFYTEFRKRNVFSAHAESANTRAACTDHPTRNIK